MSSAHALIKQLKKTKDLTKKEFKAEGLDFDDDTIISCELSVSDIKQLIKSLELMEEIDDEAEDEPEYIEYDEELENDYRDFDVEDDYEETEEDD